MTTGNEQLERHERFRELCALAMSGALTACESAELKHHLETCFECRESYREYSVLAKEGMLHLAARYGALPAEGSWDDGATRRKLFARVSAEQARALFERPTNLIIPASRLEAPRRIVSRPFAAIAAAACLALAVSAAAYWYGRRIKAAARQAAASATASADNRFEEMKSEKQAVDDLLKTRSQDLGLLRTESAEKRKEIEGLRSELNALQQRANELETANARLGEQLRSVSRQRDTLSAQLRDARRANDAAEAEIGALRADRDGAALRLASLEARVGELSTTNRDLQRKLENDGQFLSSDRDIRELMGARNLYIADVFDVDSSSHTRKPYGRVFYTRGKSLIFYAFDLDQQPNIKNARTFQVWGKNESAEDRPVNLGVLYVDNAANRRWALRCDDPEQLAEIDAVFVTVEPNAHSSKPTGKPFLYASLRKEPNHP